MQTHEPTDKAVATTTSVSEPLPVHHEVPTPDEIDQIFREAYANEPTQPLPLLVRPKTAQERAEERKVCLLFLVFLLASFAGMAAGILTYPTVTITVTPISTLVSYTMPLAIPTRTLAPVTLTKAETIPTTGVGYQAATQAAGQLTFYNGLFTSQTIPAGTAFTGQDGITVALDQPVTVPAALPPQEGEVTSPAHAVSSGTRGNIPAGDITVTITNGVLVKNLAPFTGGKNARTYRAVAAHDLTALIATLQSALHTQIPQAFTLQVDEALHITGCTFHSTPNHQAGEEASTVLVRATETCKGVAYNQVQLVQQSTTAFTTQTRPGAAYTLVGGVTTSVMSISPVIVQMRGLWVYTLSQEYEAYLAQQIAGDSPQQARAYLLHTGLLTHITVPQPLPKDPQHIKFLVLLAA